MIDSRSVGKVRSRNKRRGHICSRRKGVGLRITVKTTASIAISEVIVLLSSEIGEIPLLHIKHR